MQTSATVIDTGRNARTYAAREVAVALAVVLALHAALALWLMREAPVQVEPRETPRTIVARLLRAPAAEKPAAEKPVVEKPAVDKLAAPPLPRPAMHEPSHSHKPTRSIKKNETPLPQSPRNIAPREAIRAPMPAPTAPIPQPAPAITPTTAPPVAQPSVPRETTNSPKPVSHVDCRIAQPDYPEAAQRRSETGTAVVRFVVGTDGHIESTRLLRSSGHARLDEAALTALKDSTCHPTLEAGVPVRVVFEQPFVFGLEN